MNQMPAIKPINYILPDGQEKTANIVPVEFSTDGLNQEEMAVLNSVSKAVESLTPVFIQQNCPGSTEMFGTLLNLERILGSENGLGDFNTLFDIKNLPYDFFKRGFLFPVEQSKIPSNHPILNYSEILSGKFNVPPARNLYPTDITNEEFEALADKKLENSMVVRMPDKSLKVILNEVMFKNELAKTIVHLKTARDISKNESFKTYANAKIIELEKGTQETRTASDIAWIQNTSSIDFVLGTSVETYVDEFKGIRGAAMGAAFIVDKTYENLTSKLLNLLSDWEYAAPWQHRKSVDSNNLPKLKYVNVFTWAGDYNMFPMVVSAESLPNTKEVVDKFGSVNLVFVNVQKSVNKAGDASFISDEFFLKSEMEKYSSYMADARILGSTLHELGHTTGGVAIKEDPSKYFGEEYSRMEEARAELFSLWVLPSLIKKGVISNDQKMGAYYSMLADMIKSMQQEPKDHHGARNMMFNYLLKNEAIVERTEDGKTKYAVNPNVMHETVKSMLETLGNIKATGDKQKLYSFKANYLSDVKREEFKKRLEKTPLGTGLIFPALERQNGKYTGNLIYPATYRGQSRSLVNFI